MITINKSSNVGIIRSAKNSSGGVLNLTSASITATFKYFPASSGTLFTRRNTTAGGGDTEILVHSATNGIYEIKLIPENTSSLTARHLYCSVTIIISTVTYTEDFYLIIKDNKGDVGLTLPATRGTTANRPTLTTLDVGFQYFDTDLSSPVWWNGTEWV